MDNQEDPIWTAAWSWAIREHDPAGWDDAGRAELALWLAQSSAHRQAYAKAIRLWQLTGLIPPLHALSDDVPEPDAPR